MPPYSWIGLESVFWMLSVGVILALGIILARGSLKYSFTLRKRGEKDFEKETHDFAGAVKEQNRPVPIFIWLVTVGYFIWATAYVLFTGSNGL